MQLALIKNYLSKMLFLQESSREHSAVSARPIISWVLLGRCLKGIAPIPVLILSIRFQQYHFIIERR